MKDFVTGIGALILICVLVIMGYQLVPQKVSQDQTNYDAILQTLNDETAAFFNRDYDNWAALWVHRDYIYKSYMIMTDSSMSEMLGWESINHFGSDYIKSHPAPEALPVPLDKISVRLYGTGAWVSFQQQDPQRGRKRETRLMEKENGQWKIAGMHTTVYGFE